MHEHAFAAQTRLAGVPVAPDDHCLDRGVDISVRWLTAGRQGRRAPMSLSDRTAELLRTGAERIYSFGEAWEADGRWLVLILRVPEERRAVRHQIRTRLSWAGLGSLGGGVWVTPHAEREPELAAAIQDESAADATYAELIADFARTRPTMPEACFRMQTLLVHAWRKFPFLDPDLPAELLPARWPRTRAHDLFVDRHRRWQGPARAYFDELETTRTAQAA